MNTSTGLVQVYQTCMLVGANLTNMAAVKDMKNGWMQLLQTWLMARCKYNIQGC